MRLIYMGTPEFAVTALERLFDAGHEILACFTQPDRAKKRSSKPVPSPVKEWALSRNIPVFQPERLREESQVRQIRELSPEVICVAAYGQILSEEILEIPKFGCINIHASLLPKYRGAAPIERAILAGEEETGVTTMYMSKGLDTGDMLFSERVRIEADDTAVTLEKKLSEVGGELILKTLDALAAGTAKRTPQREEESCYAEKLTTADGIVDFSRDAEAIERQIRALQPWPCANTTFRGRGLRLFSAEVRRGDYSAFTPGEVTEVTKKSFTVACGNNALTVKRLQPEGKKQMDTAAFLNGCALTPGTLLGETNEGSNAEEK